MGIPAGQMMAVGRYLVRQRLARRERYPLVLMLEPLFRCNLSCTGCGKIQYPVQLLRRQLSVEECVAASDECGAPIVSVAGGRPLEPPPVAGDPPRAGRPPAIRLPVLQRDPAGAQAR